MTAPKSVPANKHGMLIALVGCDGSGKSTLTSQITEELSKDSRARRIYLGQGSGDLGRKIGKLPLIGNKVHQILLKKAAANHSDKQKIPGILSAVVALGFSLMRYHKCRKISGLLKTNDFLLTDRYPQAEIKGQFDGPSLVSTKDDNCIIRAMSHFEEHLYKKMAERKPDLIFRLHVTPEVAHSRKPDHDFNTLVRKCGVASKLNYNNSDIIEIDTSRTIEEIKSEILSKIQEAHSRYLGA